MYAASPFSSASIFPHLIALISSKPNFFVSPNFILISVVLAVILSKPKIFMVRLLFLDIFCSFSLILYFY